MVMALAPNLALLVLGRILSGITASSYATAAAYVADVTPVERRAAAFGMVGAAWGIGFILGPAVGGVVGAFGVRLPFWAAAVFSLVSATYAVFVLPESLARENRGRFSLRRANPIGSLGLLRSHRDLFGLATVNFIQFLAFQVLPSVYVIYAGYRYGWGPVEVGVSLAVVGALNITVQGGLVKRFIKRFGERNALITGLIAGAAAFVVWGLAPTPDVFLLAIVVFAPIGFVQPALQSLMTRRVRPSEQGQVQGANASIAGLTGVIGPILFTLVFAWFISANAPATIPGMPFFVAAVLMLGSLAVAFQLPRRVHLDHRQGRLRGREAQRPRRRPTRTMARGGPSRPWHAARAHRRPGDASAAEGARNARQGRGRRPVRRARFRHRTLAPYHRGAIRRPSQRDAVDDPCRLGEGLRPRALEDQEPRDGRGGRAVPGQAHRLHREALGTRYVDRVSLQGPRTRVRQLGTVR